MSSVLPYIRRKKNIKQSEMAKALHVSPSYLCKIEKGLQKPSKKFMKNCAEYLAIPQIDLFNDSADYKKVNLNSEPIKSQNKLWYYRTQKGIKQCDFAEKLNCSASYLSKIEKGWIKPSKKFMKNCAKELELPQEEIFF